MNPLSLCPNALHNAFWLCAPAATCTHTLLQATGAPPPLAVVLSTTNHPDIPLLTITHTQSASLSQFYATSFAHVRITIASHSHCLLEHNLLCTICAISRSRAAIDLLGCANLLVRTVSALSSMRTSLALPVARPSQHCNTDHKRFAGSPLSTNSNTDWSVFWIKKPR